jgi:hypothetical protein
MRAESGGTNRHVAEQKAKQQIFTGKGFVMRT